MAAMFKYSMVTTYTVSLPLQKLEFSHLIRHDELNQEFRDVCVFPSYTCFSTFDATSLFL